MTRLAGVGLLLMTAVGCAGTPPAPVAPTPAATAATAPPPAPVVRGALVNVKAVLRDYGRTLAINGELRAAQDRGELGLRRLREQLRLIDGKLRDPHADRLELQRLRVQTAGLITAQREWQQYDLGQQMAQMTIEVYQDMLHVVEAIRVREGYAMVLKVEHDRIKGANTGLEVNLRINTRGIVAFDDAHDITDEVLREMDARFARSTSKK